MCISSFTFVAFNAKNKCVRIKQRLLAVYHYIFQHVCMYFDHDLYEIGIKTGIKSPDHVAFYTSYVQIVT